MNKKTFSSVFEKLFLLLPILGVVIAIAYFLAMRQDFEYDIQHFATDSVWFWVFTSANIAAAVISAALAILPKKSVVVAKLPAPSPLSLFAAILSIIMAIGVFVTEIGEIAGPIQKLASFLTLFIPASMAVYCIEKYRGSSIHRIIALLGAASVNLIMFARYFDFSQPLNGPVRNVTTLIHCAVLLFLLSELRLSFGISSNRVTTAFYIFSSAVASSIALGFSVGGILYNVTSDSIGNPNESILRLGLYVAVAMVAIDRLLSFTKVSADAEKTNTENK